MKNEGGPILEGVAPKEDRKMKEERVKNDTVLAPWKVVLGVAGCVLVLVLCLGTVVGLIFGVGKVLPAGNEITQTFADIKGVSDFLPEEKRAEVAIDRYIEIFTSSEDREEFAELPKEMSTDIKVSASGIETFGRVGVNVKSSGIVNGALSSQNVELEFDVGGLKIGGSGKVIVSESMVYFKLVKVPDLLVYTLAEDNLNSDSTDEEVQAEVNRVRSVLIDSWYKIDKDSWTENLSDEASSGIEEKVFENMFDDFEQSYIESIRKGNHEFVGTEIIEEETVYHHVLDISKDDLEDWLDESEVANLISEVGGKGSYYKVDSFEIGVWVNLHGKPFRIEIKLKVTAGDKQNKIPVELNFQVEYWNFGSRKEIDIPKEVPGLGVLKERI